MGNFTQFSYFILSGYFDTGNYEYFSFIIVMLLYIFTVCANLLLIVVICLNRSLHEPMYIFLCSLFVNELFGSTIMYPFLLLQILSDIHTISFSFCYLQIFCVYTYGIVEFMNLTAMSYDRYLAICCPLQYRKHMSAKNIAILITLIWLYPMLEVITMLSLSGTLQLCGNIINKVFCTSYSIVNLACSDTSYFNINEIIGIILLLCVPVAIIFYTYIRILKVCFSGSKQTKQKAVSTCTPHLASLLNYSFGAFFDTMQTRFNLSSVPNMLRIFLSLYWLTCQPIFNPLLYGLKMSKIRSLCKNLVFGNK
ncbi:olfactory receptor 6N1-like [Centropristis striata]|uniref:olfactory receptor 6N1-like n=1 Tax=Centropristis striata TaxID=184440 RepID=UPI0027DF975B|nr:olfactory receptor 6N1-like [Centropristis striata]